MITIRNQGVTAGRKLYWNGEASPIYSNSQVQEHKEKRFTWCYCSRAKSIKMFTNKPSAVTKIRTTLFVILIVQKIAVIYSKPAIGMGGPMGPAPFGYWGSKPPPPKPSNYFRLDKPDGKNPFDASDEDNRFKDNFVSSEEDDEDNEIDVEIDSTENKKGRGGHHHHHHHHHRPPPHSHHNNYEPFYDPVIEQASVPQLQNILINLNKDEPAPSIFSYNFTPLFSTLFRKMFCFIFHHHQYCVPDNIFASDPWFEGFRSKKT